MYTFRKKFLEKTSLIKKLKSNFFFVMSDSSTMLKSPAQTLWSLLSEEDTLSIGNDGFPPLTSQESLVLHSSKQAPSSIGVKHLTFQTNTR